MLADVVRLRRRTTPLLLATLLVLTALPSVPAESASIDARIYNGQPTTAYPAVALVVVRNRDGSAGLCSGSLIAPTVVLTAGHCLSFDPVAAAIAIFPDGVTEVDIRAAGWEVHPDF